MYHFGGDSKTVINWIAKPEPYDNKVYLLLMDICIVASVVSFEATNKCLQRDELWPPTLQIIRVTL